MHSSICNTKKFFYIALVEKKIGKMNVVCEGFVFSETHDAYTFVLESFFKMCSLRQKKIRFMNYFLINL